MLAWVQIEPAAGTQATRFKIRRKVQCFRGCNNQFSDMQEPSDNKQATVTGPYVFK